MSLNLLVVDDDKRRAEDTCLTCFSGNHDADLASSLQEAINILNEASKRYSAVILRNEMKSIDGLQAATELRKAGLKIPILLYSRNSLDDGVWKNAGVSACAWQGFASTKGVQYLLRQLEKKY
jgi:DNA-binding response OmpR family regulator